MKFQNLIVLGIILIALLSISTVSASNQTDDAISVDDELAQVNEEVESNDLTSNNQTATITPDNLFDYFDSDGNSITDDEELVFEGEFNSPVNKLSISSKNINGQNAVFNNMGLNLADDVTVNGLTLISNQYVDNEGGSLIYASGSGITLQNVVLDYASDEGQDVYGLFFYDCNNFKLIDSKITFEANNHGEFYEYGIKIIDSTLGLIQGNVVNVTLPILDVEHTNDGLEKDYALGMGIANSHDILFKNNEINANVNAYYGSYPTLDAIMVIDCSNMTFSSNKISETDFITPEGSTNYLYCMDFYTTNDVLIENNNVSVVTNGGSTNAGTSYPIQLSGPYENVIIEKNNLFANCMGPVLGVFSQSFGGSTEILVRNNFINVTGLPTINSWGLVSGIEVQDYFAKIYNNTIYTQAVDGVYEDGMNLYGISYAQNLPQAQNNYDIRDNIIYTEGKYGVYLLKAINSNVTNNMVYSNFAEGNDAVFIAEGENNYVADNNLIIDSDNIINSSNFFDFFDHEGYLLDNVEFTKLIFKGEFNSLVDYIHVEKPMSLIGDSAVLKSMGFYIESDDFVLKNMKLVSTNPLTEGLIYIYGNNVNVTGMEINYAVNDDDAIVINVHDANHINILNNKINFESHVTSDEKLAMAINLLSSRNVVLDNNTIECYLPALAANIFDDDYNMMGLVTVNPVKIKDVVNIKFTKNTVYSTTNALNDSYPTIQGIFVIGSRNVLFDRNEFQIIDDLSPIGQDVYLYGINFGYDNNMTVSNNDFKMSTSGGKDGLGTAYALQGMKSDIKIIGNNITSVSNGPNIGIYVTSMTGEGAEEYIANNIINVTGLATSTRSWALVTGIEIQNGHAKIYNNTIYTYNVGAYDEKAFCYGVSYAQWMYGNRTLDIQDNTIVTEGKYSISTIATKENEITPVIIKNNNLTAHDLVGDESIQLMGLNSTIPEDNQTEENISSDMTIIANNVWVNSDNVIAIIIPNATGTVTVTINGKTYSADLNNGVAVKTLLYDDLILGENIVNVTYHNIKDSASFKVLNGIVTQDNIFDYFNQSNQAKLFDYVPEGVTLDFQGQIKASDIGDFNISINKAVNIISSTQDAFIDLNTVAGDLSGSNPGNRFTIDKSGANTNVTGITFHNTQLWLTNTNHVTLDNISVIVEGQRVGSGVGVTAIRDDSSYITVKNSNFFTSFNGGSSTLVLGWANYCTIDNNTIRGDGEVGNLFYLNTYNVNINQNALINSYNNITNNKIYGPLSSAAICRAICYMGKGNLFENNFISYSGEGFASADNAEGNLECIFRNNTIIGGASMAISKGGIAYNNTISGRLILKENSIAYDNTAGSLVIEGDNVISYDNTINGAVTIKNIINSQIKDSKINGDVTFESNSNNVSLINNHIAGTVTIIGSENIIKSNNVTSNKEYAVVMTSSKAINNIITFNRLYSLDKSGDNAVNDRYHKNQVSNNIPISSSLLVEDIQDIKVGQTAVVKIHINPDATGDVKILFRGAESTVNIINGDGVVNLDNLPEGDYSVEVRFMGDINYGAKNETKTFSVSKHDVSLDDSLTVNVPDRDNPSFTINLENDATGTLTVGGDYSQNLINGTATVTIPNLDPGKYSLNVTYSGDDKYKSSSQMVNFTVKCEPDLNASVSDIHVGDDAVITISVNSSIKECVIAILNDDYIVNLVNGKGNVTIPGLSEATYTVKVRFMGNEEFFADELTRTFTVSKRDVSSDEIKMDCNGITVEFSLTLANATGNLSVTINDVNYSGEFQNGYACVKPDLFPDEYSANVIYPGDERYNPVNKTFKFFIKMDPELRVSVDNITVGENATVFITINDEITSGVTLTLNGTQNVNIVDGKANVTLPNLSAGNYTVKVNFTGNNKYSSYETNIIFKVSKIRLSQDIITVDGNKFTVNVPEGATGNLTVHADRNYAEIISQGTASVVVNNLNPGVHDIVIIYSGDDNYEMVSMNYQLTVPKFNSTVSAETEDIYAGQVAVFKINVTGGATGNVSVIINGVSHNGTVNNSIAIVEVSGLGNGTYEVIVKYWGDENYMESNNRTGLTVLNKVEPNAEEAFKIADNTKTSSYSINLPGAKGNLTVLVNGEVYQSKELVGGYASIDVDGLNPGDYVISVVYSGDDKYSSISRNVTVNVPVPVVKLTGSDVTLLYTSGAKYTVRLTIDGAPASGKTVTFLINGKKVTSSTDKNGYASVKLELPPKSSKYAVSAEYSGVKVQNKVKVKSILSAKNLKVKKSAKTLKIKVTLKKVNGKYLKSQKVYLKFNGKTFKANTNKKGVATFKITKKVIKKLKAGKKYSYKATYLKDTVSKKVTVKK